MGLIIMGLHYAEYVAKIKENQASAGILQSFRYAIFASFMPF